MCKPTLYVRVYLICTIGCVWDLGCRSWYRLQVPGEHCALAAEVGAESPGWEAVMCSESCSALVLRKTVNLLIYSQPNGWLSRMQGLYQGTGDTMGISQIHSSHKYSSEWKSLLPGLSMIQGSVWDWEQRRVYFCTRVVVKRMLFPSLNWKWFRWERIRSNYKREKGIINGQFLVKAMWKEFSQRLFLP